MLRLYHGRAPIARLDCVRPPVVCSEQEVRLEKQLKLMVVCEEYRQLDGDDLMVLLAVNYAMRGLCEPFRPRDGEERRDLSPAEIREFVREGKSLPGFGLLVVVVLSAQPPTFAEAARMDAEYARATSSDGLREIAEGRAVMPTRFSDDWVGEVGPKCAAAILAAQEHGADLLVMVPPLRLHELAKPINETAQHIEDEDQRRDFVESRLIALRCGDDQIRVPATRFIDGPEAVAGYLMREIAAGRREGEGVGVLETGGAGEV